MALVDSRFNIFDFLLCFLDSFFVVVHILEAELSLRVLQVDESFYVFGSVAWHLDLSTLYSEGSQTRLVGLGIQGARRV